MENIFSVAEVLRTEILNTFNEVLNSQTNFRLFVEDNDLFKYGDNLIKKTLGINSKMLNHIEDQWKLI